MFAESTWRKSLRSQNGGACVEIARNGGVVGMRDSKDPTGSVLVFTAAQFGTFLNAVTATRPGKTHPL